MPNFKREAAREFINAKQYDLARSILEAISEDEIAQKWLIKLNEIAPKPRTLREMTIAELLGEKQLSDGVKEVADRVYVLIIMNIYSYPRKTDKSRHDLSDVTSQLCEALARYPSELALQRLIASIMQYLTFTEETILPGPPEMKLLERMLEREIKVADSAEFTLKLIGTLPARLLLFSNSHKKTKIQWNPLNWSSFSQIHVPAVQVYRNEELIFSTFINIEKDEGKFTVNFPEDMWNKHVDYAPLVLETTSAILQSFLDEKSYFEMVQDAMNENWEFPGASGEEMFGDEDAYNQWLND